MKKLKALALILVTMVLGLSSNALAGWISATFFSQLDKRWGSEIIGTSNYTIKDSGCALTASAMALSAKGASVDPASLNRWLTKNAGYQNRYLLVWSKVADYDGAKGLKWVGTGALPRSPADLKAQLDSGKIIIAFSKRYAWRNSDHWGLLTGYAGKGTKWSDFEYRDPADSYALARKLGDGWVEVGNAVRIYQ